MATGLIEIMKRASMDAVENAKPCDLRYGTVISTSPLKIQVTNEFILPPSVLIVPRHLSDFTMAIDLKVDIDDETTKTVNSMKIYNALKVGDKVAMIRQAGGQNYYILDRI